MLKETDTTFELGAGAAMVDHGHLVGGDGKLFSLHQWRCFPYPFATGPSRHPADRSRPAGLDAQLGMVVTLVLWGYVLDRVGERFVLTVGSALTAAAAYAAASAHSLLMVGVFLFMGGMAAASATRPVGGWCPRGSPRSSAAWRWASVR